MQGCFLKHLVIYLTALSLSCSKWDFCCITQGLLLFLGLVALQHVGSQFPDQGSNQCPLHWKADFLTTGPPGRASLVAQTKASACNAGDLGLIPTLGRSPGEGDGRPLKYSFLKNFKNRGAWQAYDPQGHKESDMTERLTHTCNKGSWLNAIKDTIIIVLAHWEL